MGRPPQNSAGNCPTSACWWSTLRGPACIRRRWFAQPVRSIPACRCSTLGSPLSPHATGRADAGGVVHRRSASLGGRRPRARVASANGQGRKFGTSLGTLSQEISRRSVVRRDGAPSPGDPGSPCGASDWISVWEGRNLGVGPGWSLQSPRVRLRRLGHHNFQPQPRAAVPGAARWSSVAASA